MSKVVEHVDTGGSAAGRGGKVLCHVGLQSCIFRMGIYRRTLKGMAWLLKENDALFLHYLPVSISTPLCRVGGRVGSFLACKGLPQVQCLPPPLKRGWGSLLTATRPPLAIPSIPILFPTHQGTGRGFNIHPADSSESKVDGIANNSGEYTGHCGPSLFARLPIDRSGQHPVFLLGKMTRYDMCSFQFQQANF